MNRVFENAVHGVAPEEVMAYLDGELAADAAVAVAAHLRECAECAALAEGLGGVSRGLRAWTVEAAPAGLERGVRTASRGRKDAGGGGFGSRKVWAWGGAVAAVSVVLSVALRVSYLENRPARMTAFMAPSEPVPPETAARPQRGVAGMLMSDSAARAHEPMAAGVAGMEGRNFAALAQIAPGAAAFAPPPPVPMKGKAYEPQGPMIARTVSLTLLVRNVAESRAVLDGLVAREQGYAAQLTFSTPEAGPRSLQASLRVPSGELTTALEGLRKLGRVEEETQSGEEVTQQHADLVARLTNSREEEARLRTLLAQRTGKIEDVLQVEEEIARVRGEIEQMEAEQKSLEHRVDFASVEVRLVEEYTARLGTPATDAGTRVHNSFVAGVRNAGASVLGLLLFVEEFGPVLLIWVAILGVPLWLVWRRYRRAARLD